MKRIAHGEPEIIKVVFQTRASCLNDRRFELYFIQKASPIP